jgi:hypothetical protein
VSTWHLLKQYAAEYNGHIGDLRPFSFFTLLAGFDAQTKETRRNRASARGNDALVELYAAVPTGHPFIGPYCTSPADVHATQEAGLFHWYDGSSTRMLPAGVETPTLAEGVREYFQRGAYKSPTPKASGYLPIPVIERVAGVAVIGKETNAVAQITAIESDDQLMGREAQMDGAQVYGFEPDSTLRERLLGYALSDLILATGLPAQTIKDIRKGATTSSIEKTRHALEHGLALLDPGNLNGIVGWRDIPNSELAAILGDPWTIDDVWRIRGSKKMVGAAERDRFVTGVRKWKRQFESAQDPVVCL